MHLDYGGAALALVGGVLIGLSASLLLLLSGGSAGVSGIVGALVARERADTGWKAAFVVGLVAAGAIGARAFPGAFDPTPVRTLPPTIVAGLLVGFGARLGDGCTSGHGIGGLARLSFRSLVAVLLFIAMGAVTVFVTGPLLGAER